MMISPQGYLEEHKNDTFEELINEREKLIDSIKHLEKLVFSDDKMSEARMIHPTPDVQYQMNLEYLAELCNYMSEKYNREIVWGEDEGTSKSVIEIRKVGITKLSTDAIVNAANDGLREGGGVCGAIFREAGSAELTKACNVIGGCKTGNAVITPGFKLPVKYIIHAVGPVWHGGSQNESKLLYSAYKQSLLVAK